MKIHTFEENNETLEIAEFKPQRRIIKFDLNQRWGHSRYKYLDGRYLTTHVVNLPFPYVFLAKHKTKVFFQEDDGRRRFGKYANAMTYYAFASLEPFDPQKPPLVLPLPNSYSNGNVCMGKKYEEGIEIDFYNDFWHSTFSMDLYDPLINFLIKNFGTNTFEAPQRIQLWSETNAFELEYFKSEYPYMISKKISDVGRVFTYYEYMPDPQKMLWSDD